MHYHQQNRVGRLHVFTNLLTILTTVVVSVAETVLLTLEDVAPRTGRGRGGGCRWRGVEGCGDGEALVTARHVITGCVPTIAQLSLPQTVQYFCTHLLHVNHKLQEQFPATQLMTRINATTFFLKRRIPLNHFKIKIDS